MSYPIAQRLEGLSLFILLTILLFCLSTHGYSQNLRNQEATPWQGGNLDNNEGAFLFQVLLNPNLARHQIDEVVVRLYLPSQAMHYSMTYRPLLQAQGATQVWRLPQANNYKLHGIEFRSNNGQVLRWDGSSPQSFSISAGSLVNAGNWYAIVLPNQMVRVIFREQRLGAGSPEQQRSPNSASPPTITPQRPRPPQQRNASQSQRNLTRSGRPLAGSRGQDSIVQRRDSNTNLRAVYNYQSHLDMVYQVDLLRHNHMSQSFSTAMQASDQQFRQCFLDHFADFHTVEGSLRFRFAYSAADQTIINLIPTENTMGSPSFVECMYWRVLAVPFQARDNIVGEFLFIFNLRSQ